MDNCTHHTAQQAEYRPWKVAHLFRNHPCSVLRCSNCIPHRRPALSAVPSSHELQFCSHLPGSAFSLEVTETHFNTAAGLTISSSQGHTRPSSSPATFVVPATDSAPSSGAAGFCKSKAEPKVRSGVLHWGCITLHPVCHRGHPISTLWMPMLGTALLFSCLEATNCSSQHPHPQADSGKPGPRNGGGEGL